METVRVVSVNLLLVSAGVSLHLALLLFRRRREIPGIGIMGFLMGATAWWSLFNALEYMVSGFAIKLAFSNLEWASIVCIPVLWYILSATLLCDGKLWKERSLAIRLAVWIVPAITVVLVYLDTRLGLFRRNLRLEDIGGFWMIRKEFGPWFYAHAAYSYGIILLGTIRFFASFRRESGNVKKQRFLLGFSVFVPWIVNFLHIAFDFPFIGADPTPMAFALSGALLIYNFWRFRFLAIVPNAHAVAANQIREAVIILDNAGRLAFLNPAACEILGISPHLAGQDFLAVSKERPKLARLPLSPGEECDISLEKNGETLRYEARCEKAHSGGRALSRIITLHDITRRAETESDLKKNNTALETSIARRTTELEKANVSLVQELERRRQTEHQLFYYSLHDPLTGLPNRSLLLNRLEQGMARRKRDGSGPLSLLYIDFDGFKHINESYGHTTGDAFLREAARRLNGCVGGIDMVARLGNDEFSVLLEEAGSKKAALETADRISAELSVPFRHGKTSLAPSASIGILVVDDDYLSPEEILRDADIAMYQAKRGGRDKRVVFNRGMRAAVLERAKLVNALKQALVSNEFKLNFQPLVRMKDGTMIGCEALCRWQTPDFGNVSPNRFIPLAEEAELIVPLGTYVLLEACKAAIDFKAASDPAIGFYVAINVSATQLSSMDFAELLLSSLKRFGLSPSDIHLEITESAIIENIETVLPVVERLTIEGVTIKLDDFGTGYSSLGYLYRYPIGCVKIDKGFVSELSVELEESQQGSSADGIVRGIISLAHSLGMSVVAEGIEDKLQSDMLKEFGCDYGQGYLFGKPMDRQSMLDLMSLDS